MHANNNIIESLTSPHYLTALENDYFIAVCVTIILRVWVDKGAKKQKSRKGDGKM